MLGRVVSVKSQKTAVVLVEGQKTHPLYKKSFVWSKKYLVDDPIGVALGDLVQIEKIRPISKMKHFQVKKIFGSDFVALQSETLKIEAEEAISKVLPEEEKADELRVQSKELKASNDKAGEKKSKKSKKFDDTT